MNASATPDLSTQIGAQIGNQVRELLPQAVDAAMERFVGMPAKQFQEQQRAIAELREREERAQRIELAVETVEGLDRSYARECRTYVGRNPEKYLGLKFGRAVRAMVGAQRHKMSAEDYALQHLKSPWLADDLRKAREDSIAQRALATTSVSAGGALTPTEYLAEMIELLRAEAVIRSSPGVRSIPMETGSLEMSRQSGAATATYRGEAVADTATDQTVELVQMTGRKLIASTAISNDLIRQANPAADMLVSEDLRAVMALREDLAFARGTGASSTPKGIRNWTDAGNVAAGSISSLATLIAELYDMMETIHTANVKFRSPFWLMHSRTFYGICSTVDTTGQPFVMNHSGLISSVGSPTLLGFPVRVSTQLPIDLGAGSNEAELMLVEGAECLIGDVYDLEINTFDGAAYYDGSNVQSAASRDESLVRAISKHDFLLRHGQGACVRTGLTLAP